MTPLRVVSPYRPFEPESESHRTLGPFDWPGALAMLALSVRLVMPDCPVVALTDETTALPVPVLRFRTDATRLMLWILEVSQRYLSSAHFDRDTILLSPDLLVFRSLRPWMDRGEFLVLMRRRFPVHPILNAVQFWPVAKRDDLVEFYTKAVEIGRKLPENYQVWGGDTKPLQKLLRPIVEGPVMRNGRHLATLIEADELMEGYRSSTEVALDQGVVVYPSRPIVDFRYLRKRSMRRYFEAVCGATVTA